MRHQLGLQALQLRLQGAAPAVEVLCPERRSKGWAGLGSGSGKGGGVASGGSLPPPVGAELQRLAPLGAVLAQVLPPEPATGQAAVVLLFFGTGSVQGFATTLLLGVLASMLTAILITRFLLTRVARIWSNPALYAANVKPAADETVKEAK